MTRIGTIAMLLTLALNQNLWASDDSSPDCRTNTPEVVNPIKDYKLTVSKMANIELKGTFSGKFLVYSVSAKPHAKDNELHINSRSGILTIAASSKDSFDVKVEASNTCGSTSSTFTVDIDDEAEE